MRSLDATEVVRVRVQLLTALWPGMLSRLPLASSKSAGDEAGSTTVRGLDQGHVDGKYVLANNGRPSAAPVYADLEVVPILWLLHCSTTSQTHIDAPCLSALRGLGDRRTDVRQTHREKVDDPE